MNAHASVNSLAEFKERFTEDPACILNYPATFIESIDPTELADHGFGSVLPAEQPS